MYVHKGVAEFLYRKMTIATYLGGAGQSCALLLVNNKKLKILNSHHVSLITPSDIAFIMSLLKNGMPVWKRKTALFESDDTKNTKVKPLFTSGKGQKRKFGKMTWSKEGLKYFHKVEATWQEAYSDKEQMSALVNGWEN
jgi:hypothetical protein